MQRLSRLITVKAPVHSVETAPGAPVAPEQLPGYQRQVSEKLKAELRNSTVALLAATKRPDGSMPDRWGKQCTAVMVKVPGYQSPLAVTAAHCFSQETGSEFGLLNIPTGHKALDFIKGDTSWYGLGDSSNEYLASQNLQPLAMIEGISIGRHKDMALLKIADRVASSIPPNHGRSLAEIPAIEYRGMSQRPLPGERVTLAGVTAIPIPDAAPPAPTNRNKLVQVNDGVYLGRIKLPEAGGDFNQLDLVAVPNTHGAEDDPCYWGASGSMAITAGGQLLGPLSLISNPNYYQSSDRIFDRELRLLIRDDLHLKVNNHAYPTICGFSVMPKMTDLQADLAAFGDFAPSRTSTPTNYRGVSHLYKVGEHGLISES